jgi:tetratricopeptide (TPR) repeat protein
MTDTREGAGEISSSPYLALTTESVRAVLACFVGLRRSDSDLDSFARSFLAILVEQGALIPDQPDAVSLLAMTLTQHVRTANHPVGWLNLAIALRVIAVSCPHDGSELNRRRLTLAADACMNSISISPSAIRSWTELGIIRHLSGYSAESLAAFEKALEVEPYDVPLWLWKAFVLEALGRHEDAIHATEQARGHYAASGGSGEMDQLFEDADVRRALMRASSMIEASIGTSKPV